MKRKERKMTEKESQVAVDILIEYIFSHNGEGYNSEFVNRIMEWYGLFKDPFTCLPCTSKEYADSSLEYRRQIMFEKYGHCDGLD